MELEEIKKLTERGEGEFKERSELIRDLIPLVWVPNFICPAGSFYYDREDSREPNDIDIIVRAKEKDGSYFLEIDKSLRLKIDRILQERVKKQSDKWLSTEWVGSTYGPNWRYQTGWDLILEPHKPQEIVEMNEPEFADEFYKQRHSREKCMECNKPPEYEVLWAEGMAHAWFCKEHFKGWVIQDNKEHTGGFTDIDYVKEVKDGVAAKRFRDNTNPNIRDKLKAEFRKLHLEEFRRTGLDEDLRNPKERYRVLFAGLRYLGNSAYPSLGTEHKWKDWTREDILKYYAKIVDKLRSVYFPIIPPKIGDKEFNTSYWKCYRASKRYIKSSPPKKDEVKEWDKKRSEIIKEDVIKFNFKKVDGPEYIVGGVVYRSKKLDAQEDFASETEVWKALKKYMIAKRHIKVMHREKLRDVPIVENYFVEEQHHKGGSDAEHLLEKGDWWLSTYLGDSENKDIWADIKSGKLKGFSMAGKAHQFSTSYLND